MRNVLRLARKRPWILTCYVLLTHQTVDLYKSITNTASLKHAATPFVPNGSVSIDDEEAKGELAWYMPNTNEGVVAWPIV